MFASHAGGYASRLGCRRLYSKFPGGKSARSSNVVKVGLLSAGITALLLGYSHYQSIRGFPPEARALLRTALHSRQQNHYPEAEHSFNQALGLTEAAGSKTSAESLGIRLKLAELYLDQHQYQRAYHAYVGIVGALQNGPSPFSDVWLAGLYQSIGVLCFRHLGKLDEAEEYLEKACSLLDEILTRKRSWRQALGRHATESSHGPVLESLADLAYQRGKYAQARKYYEAAHACCIKTSKPYSIECLTIRNNLVAALCELCELEMARTLANAALDDSKRWQPMLVPVILHNLGQVEEAAGDYVAARLAYQDAIAAARQIGDASAMKTCRDRMNSLP